MVNDDRSQRARQKFLLSTASKTTLLRKVRGLTGIPITIDWSLIEHEFLSFEPMRPSSFAIHFATRREHVEIELLLLPLATRNSQLATGNPQLAARSSQLATRHSQCATRNSNSTTFILPKPLFEAYLQKLTG